MTRLGLGYMVLALGLTACGSSSTEAGGSGGSGSGGVGGAPGSLSSECEAIIDGCLVNQRSCAMEGGQPTCVACKQGEFAGPDGLCQPIGGTQMTHTFDERTIESGEEVLGECRSWTLNNSEALYVNAVEVVQDQASHHSNWLYAPEGKFDGPDGIWDCKSRGYSQLTAALAGGVLYAQSTQATKEVQRFPDGVVVRIPPYSRIISDVHILNTTAESITGDMTISLHTLPKEEVVVQLTPFHVSFDGLTIPPRSTSRFTGECDYEGRFQAIAGTGFNPKLYFVLPHTHALGSRFFMEIMGGPRDGESIIDVQGFNSEPRGKAYWDPLDLTGATGLRFGCEFDNPRDEPVGWGFGDQEMCEALGFFESEVGFETFVSEAVEDGMDGEIQKFTGPCDTLAFPWNQEKPGGTPQ